MVAGGHAILTGGASAFPAALDQKALLEEFFVPRSGTPRLVRAAFAASGVQRRHAVVDPRVEDCSSWSTGRRMARFADEAPPLARAAVAGALARAGLGASDVGLLAVVTCTGYTTPGVDVLVARDLGLPPTARRLSIGHVGCHAALPGLATVADFVTAHGKAAVLCCLELPSLHLQGPEDDTEQLVVHALFGDAAAAVAVEPAAEGRAGLELVATSSLGALADAELMTWTVTDQGFRMTLSRHVPRALAGLVGDVVGRLLAPAGLGLGDVAHWAVHPGGPRILDATARGLDLRDGALAASRAVLAEHGNCSSATVLLLLEALSVEGGLRAGEHVVALAFGPGLTLEAALLRAC